MKLTRGQALRIYGTSLASALVLVYALSAFFEAADCYIDYWSNPNTSFNTNEANWNECKRHLRWPFSFFRDPQ